VAAKGSLTDFDDDRTGLRGTPIANSTSAKDNCGIVVLSIGPESRQMSASPRLGRESGEVHIGLLGPVVIRNPIREVPINGPRQRALLALLAAHPGHLIGADFLIDQVWHGNPPPSAGAAMRVHLAHLRKILAELSDGLTLLIFQSPGYRLHESVGTDARQFEQLVQLGRLEVGRGRPHEALTAIDDALGLWRGQALAGVDEIPTLRSEAERLESQRLDAQDELSDIRLVLGHHEALSTELASAVQQAPLREKRTAQLMLALHRSGRQADALRACRNLRRLLVDELGVEPGSDVQRLEGAILRNEHVLAWVGDVHRAPPVEPLADHGARPAADPSPATAGPDSDVPRLVSVLIAGKWKALTPGAQRLLQCLAVLDGETTVEVLAGSLGQHVVETASTIDEVLDIGGLLNRVVAPGSVAMQHRQFTLAIRQDHISAGQLADLHGSIARALQRLAPAENPQRIARHLLAASTIVPHGDIARAVVVGANEALRLKDAQEAAALTRMALDLLEDRTDLRAERIDLLMCLIGAESERGHVESAQLAWSRALALARETVDPERFALIALARKWTRSIIGDDSGDRELLIEALDRLPSTPSALRVRIGSALLSEALIPGRHVDLGSLAEEVRAGATAMGDESSLLMALSAQQVMLRRFPIDSALRELSEQFRTLAQDHPDAEWAASACLATLFLSVRTGTGAVIDSSLEAFRKAVVRSGSGRLSWHLALSECCVAGMRGDFHRASQFADEAVAVGAVAGISDALPAALIHHYLMDFHTTSVAPHAAALQALVDQYPGFNLLRAAAALAALQAGDPVVATGMMITLLDILENQPPDEDLVMTAAIAAEAALQIPQATGLLARLRALLEPYRGEFVVFGQVAGVFGPVDRYLALLGLGDSGVAATVDALLGAKDQCRAARSPIWLLRCAADSVALLRSDIAGQNVDRLSSRYRSKAEKLGLRPVVAMLDQPRA